MTLPKRTQRAQTRIRAPSVSIVATMGESSPHISHAMAGPLQEAPPHVIYVLLPDPQAAPEPVNKYAETGRPSRCLAAVPKG